MSTESFSAEAYFETQPPPPSLENDIQDVREFIKRQVGEGRRVVLVTSGGTTVPLELNVVRFLDNFSAGTRGATSAEYFLESGYAVIFMHRQFSLQPFSRHYSHSTNPFLDFLDIVAPSPSPASPPAPAPAQEPTIIVSPTKRPDLLRILSSYKAVQSAGTLHTLTFVTVNDYLWLLRAISQEMGILGRKALYYLAAAVSDFFLPRQKLSEHKIQSGKGSLHIEMDQVPKILKPMVEEWSRDGFIVSFKLETDPTLLIPKSRTALERYGHQVVIGNDLHRRKWEVVFISRRLSAPYSRVRTNANEKENEKEKSRTNENENEIKNDRKKEEGNSDGEDAFEEFWLRINDPQTEEIEKEIVGELMRRHGVWLTGGGGA